MTGLPAALGAIKMGQDKQITGALHQSLIVSEGLPVLCSASCTGRGGVEGNRSSTLIRAGVLLKMSLRSPEIRKHYYFSKK